MLTATMYEAITMCQASDNETHLTDEELRLREGMSPCPISKLNISSARVDLGEPLWAESRLAAWTGAERTGSWT